MIVFGILRRMKHILSTCSCHATLLCPYALKKGDYIMAHHERANIRYSMHKMFSMLQSNLMIFVIFLSRCIQWPAVVTVLSCPACRVQLWRHAWSDILFLFGFKVWNYEECEYRLENWTSRSSPTPSTKLAELIEFLYCNTGRVKSFWSNRKRVRLPQNWAWFSKSVIMPRKSATM